MIARTSSRVVRAFLCAAALSAATATGAHARSDKQDAELDAMFAEAGQSRAMLRLLVQQLPKGGDLHNHGGASVYAEDFIAWAAEKGGCFVKSSQALTPGPCKDFDAVPLQGLVDRNPELYSDVVDAISARRFDQGVGDPTLSGHRRFFQSFSRYGGQARSQGARILAVSLEHAALDNALYLELMDGPSAADALIDDAAAAEPWNEADMEGRLARLAPQIAQVMPAARAETDAKERLANEINACGTAKPKSGCDVTVRYLLTILRESQPQTVFGQMAFAFALVNADPRFVGINIAQPEDWPVSMRDYSLHMRMFAFFKAKYPSVPLTLHAGELALGLTAPRDLRFHITQAVEIAGAKRIGHGISIAYENDAPALLARMARDKIAVEINLTSNDVILGVTGSDHPLALYMAAGVPVVISTDDQGVARSDLTNEYFRAITEQGLRYTDVRRMSRDSLTYSFLEGASLWDQDAKPCARATAPTCAAFLKTSAKAREQWRLELALADYERDLRKTYAAIPPSAYPARP